MALTLFENQTGNASSIAFNSSGGYTVAKLSGTLDSAIITFEFDFNDNDFQPLISENVVQDISIPGVLSLVFMKPGVRVRATLSNAGGLTNVTLKVL